MYRLHYLPASGHPHNFSDSSYQSQLPPYARSTAARVCTYNTYSVYIVCCQVVCAIIYIYIVLLGSLCTCPCHSLSLFLCSMYI